MRTDFKKVTQWWDSVYYGLDRDMINPAPGLDQMRTARLSRLREPVGFASTVQRQDKSIHILNATVAELYQQCVYENIYGLNNVDLTAVDPALQPMLRISHNGTSLSTGTIESVISTRRTIAFCYELAICGQCPYSMAQIMLQDLNAAFGRMLQISGRIAQRGVHYLQLQPLPGARAAYVLETPGKNNSHAFDATLGWLLGYLYDCFQLPLTHLLCVVDERAVANVRPEKSTMTLEAMGELLRASGLQLERSVRDFPYLLLEPL